MQVKPGTRLRSGVCDTEVIVVKAADDDIDLRCGGRPMKRIESGQTAVGQTAEPIDPDFADSTLLGKQYVAVEAGLEILCTKAGRGSLTVNGSRLTVKNSKPLPSTD